MSLELLYKNLGHALLQVGFDHAQNYFEVTSRPIFKRKSQF